MKTHNETVLVVDDERNVRKLLISSLSSNGYACLEARSAEEALEQFRNYAVDLALLDINMPGKSGMELLTEVVASYPDTAVIMVSVLSTADTAVECMAEGAYDFITKPFNLSEIALRIELALEKRRLRLDNRDYQLHLEQKVREQTENIRVSEENFRNSLHNSPLGIRIVTADGKISYANPAILDIYGYSNIEELNATPTKERYTPASYLAHRERVEKRKRGESVPSNYEIGIVRKNGETRDLLVTRREVLWNGERQFQVLYQDITERKQAEKALQESLDKLSATLDAVIRAIAMIVEIRDPYTSGHQRRVAGLSCSIAKELSLSQEMIQGIRVAGTIHDIGKICVPGEILSKPGRLTKAEFSLIKRHPNSGYDIIKNIDFPWPVAQVVLQHHERMDGSGYPSRLSGESVILEARILAVADVVEAMSSHRPYRAALGVDKALEEISQKKGVLYDSKVVDACLKVFAEGFKLDSD